ncbi:MAG: hydantoinase [Calditrichaeota bacterium]|nr:MAG: hydantoinase [Calditrichota bacterium]
MPWQFWIDVGGTFTDCIGKSPEGRLHTCKVLSSGAIPGRAEEGSTRQSLVDPLRQGEPEDFYRGYTLTLVDAAGAVLDAAPVRRFEGAQGRLVLKRPLKHVPRVAGHAYHLSSGEEAPVLGIRKILGLALDQPIPPVDIRLGTTVGTNALLERKGAGVAFVTTAGFGDLPEIGTQARPELFALHIVKPALLHRRVVELPERIDAGGRVLRPLCEKEVREALHTLKKEGFRVLAVALLNAIWNPVHEELVARVAEELGFEHVSVSHRVAPTIKLLDRADTTIVDAYLSPVLRRYVAGIRRSIPRGTLRLMNSAGGLMDADRFSGRDSILSGPAGGVVGFAEVARRAGFEKAIGFDMGGTSTDVSRFDGAYVYQFAAEKAGVRVVAPMYAIETVAAGGGSICRYDGQRLLVGPESAGADPGPACYGRGGPLTLTDINLFNGKIDPRHFPFPLDREAVIARLKEVSAEMERREGRRFSLPEIAAGFTEVANQKMAAAIKKISAAQGYDPREYLLMAFGGAGAQHACAIARLLGIGTILLHPLAGILSALGLGLADVQRFAQQTVLKPLTAETLADLEARFREMEAQLIHEVREEGIPDARILPPIRYLDLRYRGEEAAITVRQPEDGDYSAAFERLHRQYYGYVHQEREVEIVSLRVEVIGRTERPPDVYRSEREGTPEPDDFVTACFQGRPRRTPVFERSRLHPGAHLTGPAIVAEAFSTIVIDPGWEGRLTGRGDLLLTDTAGADRRMVASAKRDPVQLELFNNQFTHIAERMGITLQKTALSVNVKERLDFSCAILSAGGDLVVNAPHIPVHLGAMSEAVKGLLQTVDDIRPGDAFLTNDPDLGGSHLPDLTVITPVFDAEGRELRFFAASRAHHAEIGGRYPGSAYPFARNLAEEGIVFRNLRIVREGEFQEAAVWEALTTGKYPSRSPRENVADIRAQLAANQVGVQELQRLIDHYGWPVVAAYMQHIREAAAEKVRAAMRRFGGRVYRFRDELDDGSPIQVRLHYREGKLTVDFTGSAPVHPGSLNANRAVVQSAVLYCLRCLIGEDIPLNSGMLAPVRLILPGGMLNPPANPDPERHPAVFGGNVEVSQRLVDVIFGALEVVAAAQGTMNNFIFGNEEFGYYETVCGGSGAGPGFEGASAVHTHMTNTRLTDVEVLEKYYPVRVCRFAIRRGSGGKGRWRGGDGVIREMEMLAPVEVSLLTQRRTRRPFGLKGGEPGQAGKNLLLRKGHSQPEVLPPAAQIRLQPGDRICLCTPGGGGYGKPKP